MPVIRQLPPSVINKIAAGEVIERPASVVKELVENAVDAGAKHIEVTLGPGVSELIRVADNGCGISPDQLLLAVASHATSKLRDADDLFHVATLGFRGEALASIAEISRFLIRSRTAEAIEGAQLEVQAGELGRVEPCGCSVGTTIEVRDLFLNTPVRRKFLKAASTELAHATEAFTRIALAHHDVHFVLRYKERVLYDLAPTSNWRDRIALFFGDEIGNALIHFEGSDGDIRLSGYIADPTISRGNNRLQYLFLNGRCIRDRALQHALSEAYRGLLLTGRFPVAFLKLDMPADLVDVNVHPTKLEVRFVDSGRIYSQILGSIRRKFLSTDLTARVDARADSTSPAASPAPGASTGTPAPPTYGGHSTGSAAPPSTPFGAPHAAFAPREYAEPTAAHRQQVAAWAKGQTVARGAGAPATDTPLFAPRPATHETSDWDAPVTVTPPPSGYSNPNYSGGATAPTSPPGPPPARPSWMPSPAEVFGAGQGGAWHTASETESVGGGRAPTASTALSPSAMSPGVQFHNRYLVTEVDDGIIVIDQHALHERILYEQLREKILSGKLETQRLLVPEPVTLTPMEAAAVLQARGTLADLGIVIEPFGGDTVLVTSYPAMLANLNPAEILRQVIEHLLAGPKVVERRDVLDELLHMISCKAAIKAGDRLAPDEITALLAQRHLFQDTHHCPHGRPTALVFTKEELDKRFKRI